MAWSDEKKLRTIKDILDYYEQFMPARRRNFARYVISKGFGATIVHKVGGEMIEETWQALGRRLFGPLFVDAMDEALAEHKRLTGVAPPIGPLEDPEF